LLLPEGKTAWEVLIEAPDELEQIPIASGPWWEYESDRRDPAKATFEISNWEVVEPAAAPADRY